MMLQATS